MKGSQRQYILLFSSLVAISLLSVLIMTGNFTGFTGFVTNTPNFEELVQKTQMLNQEFTNSQNISLDFIDNPLYSLDFTGFISGTGTVKMTLVTKTGEKYILYSNEEISSSNLISGMVTGVDSFDDETTITNNTLEDEEIAEENSKEDMVNKSDNHDVIQTNKSIEENNSLILNETTDFDNQSNNITLLVNSTDNETTPMDSNLSVDSSLPGEAVDLQNASNSSSPEFNDSVELHVSLNDSDNSSSNITNNTSAINQNVTLNDSINETSNLTENISIQINQTINQTNQTNLTNKTINETPSLNDTLDSVNSSLNTTENNLSNLSVDADLNVTLNESFENKTLNESSLNMTGIVLKNYCEQTCVLNSLDVDHIELSIKGNASLKIEEINYLVEPFIYQHKNISDQKITLGKSVTLNLSNYFTAQDEVMYDVPTINGFLLDLEEDILTITALENTTQSIFIYVTNGEDLIRSNEFNLISVDNIEVPNNTIRDLLIQLDVPTNIEPDEFDSLNDFQKMVLSLPKNKLELLASGKPVRVMVTTDGFVNVLSLDDFESNNKAGLDSSSNKTLIKEKNADKYSLDYKIKNNDKFLLNPKSITRNDLEAKLKNKKDKFKKNSVNKTSELNSEILKEEMTLEYDSKYYLDLESAIFPIKEVVDKYVVLELDLNSLKSLSEEPLFNSFEADSEFESFTFESLNITGFTQVENTYPELTGSGVKVCILDTGFNPSAINISPSQVTGYNFIDSTNDYSDDNGHGTAVIYPLLQSAKDVELFVGKVIDESGVGYASDVMDGLDWCQEQGVDIVSLSIGEGSYMGSCDAHPVAAKVNNLSESGILVIASTGNDGSSTSVANPACASGSLPVAASTKSDLLWNRSNFNNATLLVAPGVDISTIGVDGSSVISSGTSFVSPFVSAGAALLFENDSSLTVDSLKDLLVHSGVVLNASGRSFSRLDVGNALRGIITNNLSVGSVGSSSGSGSSDDNFTGLRVCSSDSDCAVGCPYGCQANPGTCAADSGCDDLTGPDGCCVETCHAGTACSYGSCSITSLCDNTDHCSSNTYYSGYQCGGGGNQDCSLDSTVIDPDTSSSACTCDSGSNVWDSGVSKCCGDDGAGDDWFGTGGVCLNGAWVDGGNCLSNTDCTGNCDVCSSGTCAASASLCTGNCDVCTGSGTSFSCSASASLCTGNCDVCTGSGTSFSCSASASLCTGNCDVCTGSGTSYNCAANVGLCPDTYGACGEPTCTGSGTSYNCGNTAYSTSTRCNTAWACVSAVSTNSAYPGPTYSGAYTQGYCDGSGNCDRSGSIYSDLDESAAACECEVSGTQGSCDTNDEVGCWDSGVSKCCGDDGAGDDWIGTGGVCLNGAWVDGGNCLSTSDCATGLTCTNNVCVDSTAPTWGNLQISGHRYLSGSDYWARSGDVITLSYAGYDTYNIYNGDHYLRAANAADEARINSVADGSLINNEWVTSTHINLNGGGAPSLLTRTTGTLEAEYYVTMSTSGQSHPMQGYLRDSANNAYVYFSLGATLKCDNAGPSNPSVNVTSKDSSSVSLLWTVSDALSGVDYVVLYFQKSSGTTHVANIDIDGCGGTTEYSLNVGTASSYTVSCLEPNQDYRYYVRVYDNVGLYTNSGYYAVTTDCAAHTDCSSGEYCSAAGDCTAQITSEGTACADASVIDSDSDAMCSDSTYARSCYSGYNAVCQGTAAATSGQCRRDNGQTCTTGNQCGSGVCGTTGTCVAASGSVCSGTVTCGNQCSADGNAYNSGAGQFGGPVNSGCSSGMPLTAYVANTASCTSAGSGDNRDSDCQENCDTGLYHIQTVGATYPYRYGRCVAPIAHGNACCQAKADGSGTRNSGSDCDVGMDCYAGTCLYEDGQSCTNDNECGSGYCDNDGVGLADDNHCYTPTGTNNRYDSEEPTYCEYDAGNGADIFADERQGDAIYDNTGSSSSYYGCPAYSSCSVGSTSCTSYDADYSSGLCGRFSGTTWLSSTTDEGIDSTDCGSGVSTCGDGDKSNGYCCGDDAGEDYSYKDAYTSASLQHYHVAWSDVPSDDACCDSSNDCVFDGVCYDADSSTSGLNPGGDDDIARCSSGGQTWLDCDGTEATCTNLCGLNWVESGDGAIGEYDTEGVQANGGTATGTAECCGDDADENYCSGSCTLGSAACCDSATDCVDAGDNCVADGATDAYGDDWWDCQSGTWVDIGCSAHTDCASNQYCEESTHTCTAIPECYERSGSNYGTAVTPDNDINAWDSCTASYNACSNQYTRIGPDGYCDGAGACDTNDASALVSVGDICQSGNSVNPSSGTNCGTGAQNCYCEIWNDCVTDACYADRYYVGFNSGASCTATGWVDTGSNYNVPDNYIISATNQGTSCTTTNTGKSITWNTCTGSGSPYTCSRTGADGYCDGLGSLDTNDASGDIPSGSVCTGGGVATAGSTTYYASTDSADRCSAPSSPETGFGEPTYDVFACDGSGGVSGPDVGDLTTTCSGCCKDDSGTISCVSTDEYNLFDWWSFGIQDGTTDFCDASAQEVNDCYNHDDCASSYYCNTNNCVEDTVIVTYEMPTPTNNSRQITNEVTINVTVTSTGTNVDTCTLEWNNINETMNKVGTGTTVTCYTTKTTTDGTTNNFKVYANNTVNYLGNTSTRTFTENTQPPTPTHNNPIQGARTTGNNQIINWTAGGVDAEGDTITYYWRIDIDTTPTTPFTCSGSTTTLTSNNCGTSDGTTYYWNLITSDGYENTSTTTTWNFTENTAPSITWVNVTPDDATENDDLTCEVSGWNDAEEDTTQYYFDWYNNGVHQTRTLQTSNTHTLTSSNTTALETWNCTVTPYDGYENGTNKSDSTEIDYPCNAPTNGDWNIEGHEACRDQTITITNGNINVDTGDTLELDNVTLQLNHSASWSNDINVQNGGQMITYNKVNIEPYTPTNYFYFNIRTNGIINFTDTNSTNYVRYRQYGPGVAYLNNAIINGLYYIYYDDPVMIFNDSVISDLRWYVQDGSNITIDGFVQDTQLNKNISSTTTAFAMNLSNTQFNSPYLYVQDADMNMTNADIIGFYHSNYNNYDTYFTDSSTTYFGYYNIQSGLDRITIDDWQPPKTSWTENIITSGTKGDLYLSNIDASLFYLYNYNPMNLTNSKIRLYYAYTNSDDYWSNSTIDYRVIGYADTKSTFQNTSLTASNYNRMYPGTTTWNFTQPANNNHINNFWPEEAGTRTLIGYVNITSLYTTWDVGEYVNRYFPINLTDDTGTAVPGATINLKSAGSTVSSGITNDKGIAFVNMTDDNITNTATDPEYEIYLGDQWKTNITMMEPTAPNGINITIDRPTVSSITIDPVTVSPQDTLVTNVTCSDSIYNPLTVYWNVYNNSVLLPAQGGSSSITQGTHTNVKNISSSLTAPGENWTIEFTCENDVINSTSINESKLITETPEINITYVAPTPADNNREIANSVTINVTVNTTIFDVDTCTLEWNDINETMNKVGTGTNVTCYTTKTTTDGTTYDYKVYANNTAGTTNNASQRSFRENAKPTIPTLDYPTNGDDYFTNRTPRFNWSLSTDADTDSVTYTFQLSLASDFSATLINQTGIPNNNYTVTNELDFNQYFWRVKPSDGYENNSWSTTNNFTLVPSVIITLVNDEVNFSNTLDPGATDDTTDNSPQPLRIRNDGNIQADLVNISGNQSLFERAALGTKYWQFKADNASGFSNAFDWSTSIITWTNITNTNQSVIRNFNYTDTHDEAEIDIRVEVPQGEPPGEKQASIILQWEESP